MNLVAKDGSMASSFRKAYVPIKAAGRDHDRPTILYGGVEAYWFGFNYGCRVDDHGP